MTTSEKGPWKREKIHHWGAWGPLGWPAENKRPPRAGGGQAGELLTHERSFGRAYGDDDFVSV
jgi:hypothetical protein